MNRFYLFSSLIYALLALSGCRNTYPNLGDVPDYQPPSIAPEDAQKELDELRHERAEAQKLTETHGRLSSSKQ